MPTLLLRLCGPMQSWGTRSRFSERDTELEPSKSGVIGLLCAALGRSREDPVDDLGALRFGVRVDNEGRVASDYQTAGGGKGGGIRRASGALSSDAVLSNRYYLQDADFLVGFEGDDLPLLQSLEEGVEAPRWQLFLGRKGFVPALPVYLPGGGIRDLDLLQALKAERWPLPFAPWRFSTGETERSLRYVIETSFDSSDRELRYDQPQGAAFRDRTFGPRAVIQSFDVKERFDVLEPSHS